ncbi:MAG: response regulator [Bdellovibrio sp.]
MTTFRSKLKTFAIYLLVLVTMFAAVSLRVLLVPIIGTNTAYLTVFPTIACIAVIAGTWPALFAAVVGSLMSESWAFGPITEFFTISQVIRVFMTVLTGTAVGYLSTKLKKSTQMAQEKAEASRRSEMELLKTTIELRQQQKDLQEAKNAAQVASNEKLNFLATMSHELRTPLTSILGFSELLGEENLAAEEKKGLLTRVKRNGELLTRLIDEILDLSKIESGKIEIELMDVDLQELINDVIGVLSLQAQKKGIELRFKVEDGIPKTITTDPTRLRQILSNLIGNAIKFTSKGWVQVSVKAEPNANLVHFLIEDTGEGISSENAEKIFEPFVQADSSHTRRFGGTGLGLVLSRKIARTLGGDVNLIKSVPGKGSIFEATVELKKNIGMLNGAVSYGDQKVLVQQKSENTTLENQLNGIHILVVDDSKDNQLLVSLLLNHYGASVETASSGQEALGKTKNQEFDIVLMDIQMPQMDGYETVQLMRERDYKKPIIALSAYAMRSDLEKSLESGFNDHVSKPINKSELIAAILKYYKNSQNEVQQ